MSSTSYVVPLITAGGTVVAAILTGFGAASLKHKWDVDDNDLRWKRERAERRRDELRSALIRYLATRNEVSSAFMSANLVNRVQADVDRVSDALVDYRLSFAELETLLDDGDLAELTAERAPFGTWIGEAHKTMKDEERKPLPATPADKPLLVLIKRLLAETESVE